MNYEELCGMIPESFKYAVRAGQFHKVAAEISGLKTVGLPEILQHIGVKLAERQTKYRVINDGLLALQQLQKD